MFGKLLLLFIIVPILELTLFIQLGDVLGLPATLAIIVLTAFLGAALTKSQGRQALANFNQALASGKMPHREATDGLLILIAGAVLLTPGFLTDAFGFALLFPPTRAFFRHRLAAKLKSSIRIVPAGGNPFTAGPGPEDTPSPSRRAQPASNLDRGDVIDV